MTPSSASEADSATRRASSVRISTRARRGIGTAALVLVAATLPAVARAQTGAEGDPQPPTNWVWPQRLVLEGQASFGDPPSGYYGLALDVALVPRLSVIAGVGIGPSVAGMGGLRVGVMPQFTVVEVGETALSLGLGYALKKSADIDVYRVGDEVRHVETRWDPAHRIDGEVSLAHRFASGLRLRAFAGVARLIGDGDTTLTILPASSVVGWETLPTAPQPPPIRWSGYAGLALGFGAPRAAADPAPLSIKGWYGWQILAIDLPSIVAFTLGRRDESNPNHPAQTPRFTATVHAALGAFALGGPVVHLAHGHGWRAGASLATRLVVPLAVFLIHATLVDEGECAGLECSRDKALIATSALTSLADAALLSWR